MGYKAGEFWDRYDLKFNAHFAVILIGSCAVLVDKLCGFYRKRKKRRFMTTLMKLVWYVIVLIL